MNTIVECYAGSSSPETPRALVWVGQRFTIQTILERWREPHGIGFLVLCMPGEAFFDLFYTTETNQWQIHPKNPAVFNKPLNYHAHKEN